MMIVKILVFSSSVCVWPVVESPRGTVVALQLLLSIVLIPQDVNDLEHFERLLLSPNQILVFVLLKWNINIPVQIKTNRRCCLTNWCQSQKEEKKSRKRSWECLHNHPGGRRIESKGILLQILPSAHVTHCHFLPDSCQRSSKTLYRQCWVKVSTRQQNWQIPEDCSQLLHH